MSDDFRPVLDSPGYRVNAIGRVQSCIRRRQNLTTYLSQDWKDLKPVLHQGYPVVQIYKAGMVRFRKVHSLVLEAFVSPRPEGKFSRHLNGVRSDCRLENLCWGTPAENSHDRIGHGTLNRGSGHGMSKLKEGDVLEIRRMRREGMTAASIAKLYKVSDVTICLICKRKTWTHVN